MSLLTDGQIDAMRATVAQTFDRTATILAPQQGTDRYGNQTPGYVEVAWYVPCSIATASQSEVTIDRDTQITNWVLRLPPDTRLSGRHRIRVAGLVYEVIGEPELFPTHLHANCRVVDG